MIHDTDPDNYLPSAHAPVVIQCARLDSDDNVRACPEIYRLACGPKKHTGMTAITRSHLLKLSGTDLPGLEAHLKLAAGRAGFREIPRALDAALTAGEANA